jgi:hypothetical protein
MKITSFKYVQHEEMIIIQEVYQVRVRIKKGQIITLHVDVEDGGVNFWKGNTAADTKIINSLTGAQRTEISTIINEKAEEDL